VCTKTQPKGKDDMTTEAGTKIYAGLDLHGNNVMCSLRDEAGRTLIKRKADTTMSAVLEVLDPFRERIAMVGVEATFNWYWLVDGLRAAGLPVVLANPARRSNTAASRSPTTRRMPAGSPR
jgi:transposase